eukprot:466798-Rhodomonas_salina.3
MILPRLEYASTGHGVGGGYLLQLFDALIVARLHAGTATSQLSTGHSRSTSTGHTVAPKFSTGHIHSTKAQYRTQPEDASSVPDTA